MEVQDKPELQNRSQTRLERYNEYLQSNHWQDLKADKRREVGNKCQVCKIGCHGLHGHHVHYRQLWDCTTADILMLCWRCHKLFHQSVRHFHLEGTPMELPVVESIISEFLGSAAGILSDRRDEDRITKQHKCDQAAKFHRHVKGAVMRAKRGGFHLKSVKTLISELQQIIERFGH